MSTWRDIIKKVQNANPKTAEGRWIIAALAEARKTDEERK